jgi:hypothetical protein
VLTVGREGVSLTLTNDQVELVLADVAARAGHGELHSVVMSPGVLAASQLLEDRTVSRSLLYGLMTLSCLPPDGSEWGITDIARELGLPDATVRRYIYTLRLIGLLEQNPQTRKYYRASTPAQGSQSEK